MKHATHSISKDLNARRGFAMRPVACCVMLACCDVALANPTGPQVINGNVAIQGLGTGNLKITNSPGSIIHWQGFSIGAGEATRFVQQSSASAVLNRVVGADISRIHGQLVSNGRVFLINPAGIVIGASGVIDTAGFIGSTLNMQDADFLAGRLRFQGDSGSIRNDGVITARHGGNVVLIAPQIENGEKGVIQSEGGQLILAAGRKVTIASPQLEGVQFEVQAPTDSVLNMGKLIADGGAVGVFAGTLKHSGDIRANALTRDGAGRVVLKAQGDTMVSGNSTTSATGGKGGTVHVLGNRVGVTDTATIDVSGETAGGTMLIGGDYRGENLLGTERIRDLRGAGHGAARGCGPFRRRREAHRLVQRFNTGLWPLERAGRRRRQRRLRGDVRAFSRRRPRTGRRSRRYGLLDPFNIEVTATTNEAR